MTSSMLTGLRNPGQGNGETMQETEGKNDGIHVSIQEEILMELRSINEVLKGIANAMETMEQSFWT